MYACTLVFFSVDFYIYTLGISVHFHPFQHLVEAPHCQVQVTGHLMRIRAITYRSNHIYLGTH